MEEKIFKEYGRELTYLISYPQGFDENKTYPLVIFLHGRGEQGETTEKLINHNSFLYIKDHQDAKGYILLAPLCSSGDWNEWMAILLRLIETTIALPCVDKAHVHITGTSMGGYGTWEVCLLRPHWFASAMPLCSGGICGLASQLVGLPIRAFHGLCDGIVDPIESLQMVKAINMAGGHAELILFPHVKHKCWEPVYSDEKNYDWLLSFTNERIKTQ